MKKISLYIGYVLLAASTSLFMGCDFDDITGSSSSSDDKFDYEETRFAQSKSQPTADEASTGVLSVVRCGDLIIYIMDYTAIQRVRESCSGFNNSNDVEIGDLVTVYFHEDQINWATGKVRPNRIEAIARNCVPVYKPDFECEPCGE